MFFDRGKDLDHVLRKPKIGVLGASGYTGSEIVRLLLRHPQVEIALLTADRRAGQEMREVFPQFSPFILPKLVSIDGVDWARGGLDLVFCALPHATTQKVVDGAARRGAAAPRWSICRPTSGSPTPPPMRAGTATSIMRRSCRRRRSTAWSRCIATPIKTARLVANPGCYTTCAQLPLVPLLKAKAIDPDEIVDRRQVGHDRGGRAAKEDMLFSEVSEGFHAYGVGHHRHMAELDQEFSLAAGREVVVTFTPHLVPMNRGILSTIYVRGLGKSPEDLHAILAERLCGRAVRACAAVRRDAADAPCARLQHDLHRRRQGPQAGPRHHRARRSTIWSRARPGRRCRT